MGGVILEKATPIRKEMPLSDKYDRSEELQSRLASLSKWGMKINKCPQRIKRVNSCLVFFPFNLSHVITIEFLFKILHSW